VRTLDVAVMVGARGLLRGDTASRMGLIEIGKKGVTKEGLLRLGEHLSLSRSQLADILHVSERTIRRYRRNQRSNSVVSEQVLQIAEVTARATDVFGAREPLVRWMKSPCRALGNRIPVALLRSRFGAEIVLDELGRIEHGALS